MNCALEPLHLAPKLRTPRRLSDGPLLQAVIDKADPRSCNFFFLLDLRRKTDPTATLSTDSDTMRPLTEKETQTLFEKLANYTGNSLKNLIAPLDDSPNADRYVFRLHRDRVYYVRLSIANLATSIARDKLLSLGTCLGKNHDQDRSRQHPTDSEF